MQTDTSRSGNWRLLIGGSIVAMLLAGGSIGAVAPVAYGQEATAETAAINAAQILFEKKEYAAARELLRAYVADPKAALTFVRAGLALKLTDATDIALMAAQSQQGNATASRILGDLLRAGETPDLANAEVAYRLAVAQGDKASKLRMAQLFAIANRILNPEPECARAIDSSDDPRCVYACADKRRRVRSALNDVNWRAIIVEDRTRARGVACCCTAGGVGECDSERLAAFKRCVTTNLQRDRFRRLSRCKCNSA